MSKNYQLILILLILLSGCSNPRKATPDINQDVVFMSRADSSQGELYFYNASLGEIFRLTNNDRHENNPALSRENRFVAFHAGNESNPLTWEIYYIDLETRQEYRLTNNYVIDGHPDWSPNSEQIVYSSFIDSEGNPEGVGDIFVVNRNATGLIRLTNNEFENNDPEWSPDGSLIAFKSTRRKNDSFQDEVYVMNVDGANVKRLTTTSGWNSDHDVSWSPDSKYLVFTRYQGSIPWINIADIANFNTNYPLMTPWNCFKVDLNGEVEQLTFSNDLSGLPVYSSNNDYVMYVEYEPIRINDSIMGFFHKLKIINTDGTDPKMIFFDEKHTYTLEYFDW